jgi:hypothetical protein
MNINPMRLMNHIFPATVVVIVAVFAGAIYGAKLSYDGYCFSQKRYLSDDEKIRLSLTRLLDIYPPAVIRKPIESEGWSRKGWSISPPSDPIAYRDLEEFFLVNPDCCKVNPTEKYIEGGGLTLIERLTGTATSVIEVAYLVRYRDSNGVVQSVKTKTQLHITSCGSPGKPWSPY